LEKNGRASYLRLKSRKVLASDGKTSARTVFSVRLQLHEPKKKIVCGMRHSIQLVTTAEALRRVFFPALNAPQLSPALPTHHCPWTPLKYLRQPCWTQVRHSQCRQASTYKIYRPDIDILGDPDESDSSESKRSLRPPRGTILRDDNIQAWKVLIVNADGKLSEPKLLRNVLDDLPKDDKGRPTHFVQQVAFPDETRPEPLCKIFDKKDYQKREMERKKAMKAAKATKGETKQLELNWSIGGNDLDHRLGRLKEFLAKGWKVEVIFGSKRKSGWKDRRLPTTQEAEELLGTIRGAVSEVEGSKERGVLEGKILGEAVMHFEGSRQKS